MAEQQEQNARYEAQLANMTDAQKAALYGEKAGKGLFVNPATDTIEAIKAVPGLYIELLKKEWRLITLPSRLTLAALRSVFTLDAAPLKEQIHAAGRPLKPPTCS